MGDVGDDDPTPDSPDAHPAVQQAFELGGDAERITAYYDEWAATYDTDLGDERYAGPAMCVQTLRRCPGTATLDVADPDLTIVDGGCGTGLVGVELARAGYRVIDGVDLSPGMIEAARARGVYRDLEADIDLTRPPPQRWAGAADVMVLTGVFTLGHLPGTTLEMLTRWIRPGGLLVVSTRKQYYDTSDYRAVSDRLVGAGFLREQVRIMDAPGTEDSPAHYFGYEVLRPTSPSV